ncbi:iron-containing redox enzyme family protein [Actinomadura sp. GTD37]|uniref:iron-containing redox enzyme family protein n=1 Tax=Actinomadura sp. GTD37 TaxID=1778030 RepID=UPI0035C18BA1
MRPPSIADGDPAAFRDLYLWADDPEQDFWPGPILDELTAEIRAGDPEPGDPRRAVIAWAGAETARFRSVLGPPAVRRILLNCAPLALKAGAWLQWLAGSGNTEDELTMHVLGLYAEDVGAGRPGADRAARYRRLLEDAGLGGRLVPAERPAADRQIADRAFRLPALLLAMSRYPGTFTPELLGADLCLRWAGLLPPLRAVRAVLGDGAGTAGTWAALDLGGSPSAGGPDRPDAAGRSLAAVRSYLRDHGGDRPWRGLRWTFRELRAWTAELHALAARANDPAYEMAELLRLRAREASAYHHDLLLDGRPLSAWFATDCEGLVGALAASRFVRPGRPDASPLVRGLLAGDGPMFRVFSPDDLAVLRRWITSLAAPATGERPDPEPADAAPPVPTGPGPAELTKATAAIHVPPPPGSENVTPNAPEGAPGSLREAYRRLLRRDDSPAVNRYALDYVEGWLRRSGAGIERVKSPPREWRPGALRSWLRDQHDRHDEQFRAGEELPVPPREEVVDAFVQLAPLNLIDGGWLSGFTDHRHAVSDLGRFLFATYWDELGNGELTLNHPLIYRALMRDMGLDLPPTASREFAEWPGFRDESFELPVYWLALGRFPRTFLPETLGLNLAMEMSGVGGTYRRDRAALRAHGFSSRYADVHNTIDNVATGHSAWAADAIDAFLSGLAERSGRAAAGGAWHRMRVGFRSLRPPARRAAA